MTSSSKDGTSDIVSDKICKPCSLDNKNLEAVGYCDNCSEFLCDECFKYHLKPPLTRNHKLLNLDQARHIQSSTRSRDICTKSCEQHRREIIKYYCLDHDCLGCEACKTLDHKCCQHVKYIPEIAEHAESGKDYTTLIQELDRVILRSKSIIERSERNKTLAQAKYAKVLDNVQKIRKDVNKALDDLERDIKAEAGKIKVTDTQRMSCNVSKCESVLSKAETLSSDINGLSKDRQYCSLFVAMKKDKDEIMSLEGKLDKIADENSVTDFLFQPGKTLHEFLHVTSHGKLCLVDQRKTKATHVENICVKSNTDVYTCSVYGMAMLPNNRLVVADYDNEKVKLVDINQSKIIFEFKVPTYPWDITTTDQADEIAVTIGRTIWLLKVRDDALYEDKKINTSNVCYGINCIGDRLIVSTSGPERLEIIDKQGTVLQSIEKDGSGKQLFSNIWSIAVSKVRGTIYVPDIDKHTVTCLSLSGDVKGVYQDNDLKEARAVTIDQTGTVYVGGWCSNNIHQITPGCKKVSILLSSQDGVSSPYSLCYCEETDRLYVGQSEYDDIKIYQMQ